MSLRTNLRCAHVSVKSAISRFHKDETASISIETVLMFPLLVWVYLAMFVYFDAFRAKSQLEKATFTMSDMIGRETDYITPTYIDSLYDLHGVLTNHRLRTGIRVTVLKWNEKRQRYYKVWSQRRGKFTNGGASYTNVTGLRNTRLQDAEYTERLPTTLLNNERLIMIETWGVYEPPFDLSLAAMGSLHFQEQTLEAFEFEALVFSRPRFSHQVCWNADPDLDASKARC